MVMQVLNLSWGKCILVDMGGAKTMRSPLHTLEIQIMDRNYGPYFYQFLDVGTVK